MINIFIPIIENVEGFCEFIAKHKEKEAHIYVGIRKSLKEKFVSINNNNNVEIHIFDDKAKKEEIINELQCICQPLCNVRLGGRSCKISRECSKI